jgi:hypothetical protein
MKTLLDRIKAKETELGKVLAYYFPSVVVLVASTLEVLQALHVQEIEIPFDVKKWIGILTVVSLVLGKLTVKKDA